jgi:hypothetical protein
MKTKLLSISLLITLVFSNCNALKKAGLIPSELDMVRGLKAALEQGMLGGFDAFANPQKNNFLKLLVPGEVDKLENVLNLVGLKTNLAEISNKLTYAMSSSMAVSKPIFVDALRKMSIKDASKILITNNNHAATDYFKQTTSASLNAVLVPIVDSTLQLNGIKADYEKMASLYNAFPFINKKIEPSASAFVAGRAMDLMFMMVAKEEQEIRQKYQLRKSDLLQKVFGYAEKEVKRKFGTSN